MTGLPESERQRSTAHDYVNTGQCSRWLESSGILALTRALSADLQTAFQTFVHALHMLLQEWPARAKANLWPSCPPGELRILAARFESNLARRSMILLLTVLATESMYKAAPVAISAKLNAPAGFLTMQTLVTPVKT